MPALPTACCTEALTEKTEANAQEQANEDTRANDPPHPSIEQSVRGLETAAIGLHAVTEVESCLLAKLALHDIQADRAVTVTLGTATGLDVWIIARRAMDNACL